MAIGEKGDQKAFHHRFLPDDSRVHCLRDLADRLVRSHSADIKKGRTRMERVRPLVIGQVTAASVAAALGARGHGLHHPAQVEAAWLLARRELLEALQPLPDVGGRRGDQERALHPPLGDRTSPHGRPARRGRCAG